MTTQFAQAVSGDPISAADWNDNFTLVQESLADIGDFVISGLTLSAGAGLAVTVAAGVAVIGARVTASGSFSIAGLTDSTTNHLYLRDDGVGVSNTTGTQPADTVKLGTATTSGGVVTSTSILRSSGRQQKVRSEDLVHGGSAGNPRAVDLAQWAASTDQPNEVKGTLPAGALPAISLNDLSDVNLPSAAQGDILYRNSSEWVHLVAGTSGQFLKTQGAGADPIWATVSGSGGFTVATKTANYTVLTTDQVILGDATSGSITLTLPAVSGNSGVAYRLKKIDSSANTVTVDGNASETIDGGLTAVLSNQYEAIDIVCDGSTWWIF